MSLVPSLFGRRSSGMDPFSLDVWDPFRSSDETSQFAATRVDWKETPEAHISGERSREKEEKNDTWHAPHGAELWPVPPPLPAAGECQDG
ncbi:hypothetical protein C2S52_006768 [Perilla frutescens var. hirtella]|nr:hypothetical protein C2S52_006768 [Perilla frutescens var. hirtella]